MKIKRIITISVIAVTAVAVLLAGALIAFLMKQYNDAYVKIDFVEKTGTYVMPEYPEVEYDSGAETVEDTTDAISLDTVITADTVSGESTDSEPAVKDSAVTEQVIIEPIITDVQAESSQQPVSAETKKTESTQTNTVKKDTNIYGGVPIEKVAQKDKDVFNVLLIGQDLRFDSGKRGRSDTMIVVSYNKKTSETKIISFLRDSLVPINNHGWNRLNTAYSFGGIGLTINTINNLFDLDIQNFVVIDLLWFIRGIDYIGGLDIWISADEANYYNRVFGYNWQEGVCHLDGVMVKEYIRSRSQDSDFGRTKRQRIVLEAIIQKIVNEKSIPEILDIIDHCATYVKTNMSISTMGSMAMSVVSQKSSISVQNQTVPFADSYKYAYYNRMAIISFDIDAASKRINQFLYN